MDPPTMENPDTVDLKKLVLILGGKEEIPIYCSHCPQAHTILAIEIFGKGNQMWVHDYENPFPKKPGDPCIHYIYKDPDKVPNKYYESIGM